VAFTSDAGNDATASDHICGWAKHAVGPDLRADTRFGLPTITIGITITATITRYYGRYYHHQHPHPADGITVTAGVCGATGDNSSQGRTRLQMTVG
jgi:hypothetical protein